MKAGKVLAALLAALAGAGAAAAVAGAENPASGTAGNGADVRIQIEQPLDGATVEQEVIPVSGSVGLFGSTTRVAYVIDASSSTYGTQSRDCNGDGSIDTRDNLNGDALNGNVIDCEIAGLEALNASLGTGSGVQVGVVPFATEAVVADVSPEAGVQTLTSPEADGDGDGRPDPEEVLRSVRSDQARVFRFTPLSLHSGGTSYAQALHRTNQLQQGATGQKVAYFVSDGNPTDSSLIPARLNETVAAGIVVHTFAVGGQTAGCGQSSWLRHIAQSTGGICTVVLDPADLATDLAARVDRVMLAVGDTDEHGADLDFAGGGPGPVDTRPPSGGGPVTHVPPPYRGDAVLGADGRFSGAVRLAYGPNLVKATAQLSDGTVVTASVTVHRLREPTALAVEPSVARVVSPGTTVTLGRISARLTSKGAPVAGRSITFAAGTTTLCRATTDADGIARCTDLTASLTAVLGLRHQARFAGDHMYRPAAGTGSLAIVGGVAVPR